MLARRRIQTGFMVFLAMLTGACATKTFERPAEFDVSALRERAETVVSDDIRVSAAIPSRDQIGNIFGVDLSSKSIQPLWLEIENNSDRRLYFLRTGLDPEYFAPREVAFLFYGSLSDEGKKGLDEHLERLNFENPIAPNSTVSGFLYTNEDKETKFVSVDLLSPGWSIHSTLVVPNPERSLSDGELARIHAIISESRPLEVEEESKLRTLLEKLPCCTANKDGVQAEPLNVVIIGELDAAGPALVRRRFFYSPAAPLYAFGRPQDVSARKGDRWVVAQPHVLRLWLTNFRYQGKLVWVGQISTPLGGRFADTDGDETLPAIDPEVDVARDDLVQDAIFSQLLTEVGFVKGVGAVARTSPRSTPSGSSYYTDGLRAVLIFENEPVSMTEIEIMSWELLVDHARK